MGKKSTPKAPKAPDPQEMIQAEAEANRVNTYTPYGSQTYTQNFDGTWRSDITPNDTVKALIDRQMQMAAAEPSTFSSGGAPQGVQDRLAEKLGGMSDAQYNTTEFGAVDLPAPEQAPALSQPVAPPQVGQPRKPSIQALQGIRNPNVKVNQR